MTHEVEAEAVVVRAPAPPSEVDQILRLAIDKGVPVDTIERLVALKERAEERFAAAEFNQALTAFQSECGPILKSSTANVTTAGGGSYQYRYAELDQIDRVTRPLLTKHGLSYTWDSDMENDRLICTCILRHIAGHSQSAKFVSPTDSKSSMSSQQRYGAALTFAKRQSLIQVLGLTTTEHDTDGASDQRVTEEQIHTIEEWLTSSGADRKAFLKYMNAEKVPTIFARDFQKAIAALKAKDRAARSKPGGGA